MSAHGNEHGNEPIRGLPAALPEGEHILWQGAPDWRTLAVSALHIRWVAAYFAGLTAWRIAVSVGEGLGPVAIAGQAAMAIAAGVVTIGLLVGYAYICARSTVYTLTNKRFVLRHGVALSKCFNIPFNRIASADLKLGANGVGDIPLMLTPESKIGYPHLWPHARPLKIVHPQPMMRALPDARAVAERLTAAWQAELGLSASAIEVPAATATPAPSRRPAAPRHGPQPATA